VIALWVVIAAIALTATLIAAFSQRHPAHFTTPVKIYPVTQELPGPQCPPGVRGAMGQGPSGPVCYQLSVGIILERVNDMHVERVKTGGYAVSLDLIPADGRALTRLTRSASGRPFALTVRDQVVAAPRVDAPITKGHILITGYATRADATGVLDRLKGRAVQSA
jgi:hypothetical protein